MLLLRETEIGEGCHFFHSSRALFFDSSSIRFITSCSGVFNKSAKRVNARRRCSLCAFYHRKTDSFAGRFCFCHIALIA